MCIPTYGVPFLDFNESHGAAVQRGADRLRHYDLPYGSSMPFDDIANMFDTAGGGASGYRGDALLLAVPRQEKRHL
jgi:hypothetical protein